MGCPFSAVAPVGNVLLTSGLRRWTLGVRRSMFVPNTSAQLRGEVDGDDRVVMGGQVGVQALEGLGARLGRLRVLWTLIEHHIELVGGDGHLVDVRGVAEAQLDRYDVDLAFILREPVA